MPTAWSYACHGHEHKIQPNTWLLHDIWLNDKCEKLFQIPSGRLRFAACFGLFGVAGCFDVDKFILFSTICSRLCVFVFLCVCVSVFLCFCVSVFLCWCNGGDHPACCSVLPTLFFSGELGRAAQYEKWHRWSIAIILLMDSPSNAHIFHTDG